MSKKKIRFTIMDALILLVILAAVAALLYVFVFNDLSSMHTAAAETHTLTYVVEVTAIDEEQAAKVLPGATVINSASKIAIGTVTAVETRPYMYMGTNKAEGSLVLNPVDGKVNLYLTVQADAVLDGISYSVNGFEVYVGGLVHMAFNDVVCSGYCISLDAAQ